MATGKALDGKPYAGKPHVRFDEGEVAPAATPRRGSLLYKKLAFGFVLSAAVALCAASVWAGSTSPYGEGGEVTFVGDNKDAVHTFTATGDNTFELFSEQEVWFLVVGGGGAGGNDCAGGGGAGGFVESNSVVLAAGTYTVTVGAGGQPTSDNGGSGGDSAISNGGVEIVRAIGGGGGGAWAVCSGSSGGSGGGATQYDGNPGAGVPGQGNAGGYSTTYKRPNGGGGAGAAGGIATGNKNAGKSGDGGDGLASSISGVSTYYAGGGGGGGYNNNPGNGGLGGGGNGADTLAIASRQAATLPDGRNQYDAEAGVDGLGGGGGGGNNGDHAGRPGGSGVVVIRIAGDPNSLLEVSSDPEGIGSPSPAYGGAGLSAGDTVAVSCGATAVTNEEQTIFYTCTGWKLYDDGDNIISNGSDTAFTYTHPSPAAYRRLEWQWSGTFVAVSFEFSSKPAGDGVELKATLVEVTPETAFSTGDLYMQLAKKGSPLPAAAKVASGFAAGDTFTTNLTGFASSGTYAVRFTYVSSGSSAAVAGDAEFSVRRAPVDVGSAVNVAMFSHRARVSFEAYKGASALADFPVLVRLSESMVENFSYGDLVDGNDLVFTDDSGHILACEVDTWDPDGESLIWVRVPSLAASTQIYMYYGTRSSYGAPCTSATNVWSKYVGVYHLGSGLKEAGGSGRDLVKPGWASVSQAGLLGECVTNALPTSMQNLRFPTPRTALADATCFTVTVWIKPDSRSIDGPRLMASKQLWRIPDGFEFALLESGSTRALRARTQAADDNNQVVSSYSADYIPHYIWTHIGARYDGGSLAVFDNGANIASGNKNAVTGDDCGYWGIFGLPSSTAQIMGTDANRGLSYFQGWTMTGLADEVRVYNGAASDLWVKTEHDTVSNQTFSRVTVDTSWTGTTGFSVHIL